MFQNVIFTCDTLNFLKITSRNKDTSVILVIFTLGTFYFRCNFDLFIFSRRASKIGQFELNFIYRLTLQLKNLLFSFICSIKYIYSLE